MPIQESSRRPRRRKTDEKLDLDELSSAPNLGGMLSFLSVSPGEARRRQFLRDAIETERTCGAGGQTPTVVLDTAVSASLQVEEAGQGAKKSDLDHFPSLAKTISNDLCLDHGKDDRPPVDHCNTVGPNTTVVNECTVGIIPTVKHDHHITVGFYTTEVQTPSMGPTPTVDSESFIAPSPDTVLSRDTQPLPGDRARGLRAQPHDQIDPIRNAPIYDASPTVVRRPTVGQEHAESPSPTVDPTIVRDPIRKARVFRATLVQHGHTPAEQLLYLAMWSNGKETGSRSREITAGYRQLGHLANLNDKTVKYALQSLVEKLAIQVIAEEHVASRTGRTYRVFSYEHILATRNQAGLIWVRKNKGVEFVEPPTVVNRPTVVHTSRAPIYVSAVNSVGPKTTEGATPTAPVVHFPPDTVGSFTTPLGNVLGKERNQTSTSTLEPEFPTELLQGLLRIVPFMDEEAICMLWTECRARVSDCTISEVLGFVQSKAAIALNGKIQNPVGFLLAVVPKCFEGSAFAAYREEENRRKKEDRRRQLREQERQKQLEEQGREEAEAYERGKRKLESLSRPDHQALYERTRQELLERYPNALRSAPETFQDMVEQEMIRQLQDTIAASGE